MQRFASNYLHLPDGTCLTLQVVEVEAGRVARRYPLTEELPDTVWVPGTLTIDEQGKLRADKRQLPAGETLHTPQQ